uniref:Uncharacterized protein n=1 Tax=Rhizophora mucronata TaxID=61149 RepID=A0A2P2N9Q8_RHIMU
MGDDVLSNMCSPSSQASNCSQKSRKVAKSDPTNQNSNLTLQYVTENYALT